MRVVRLRPMRVAAPSAPPTRPLDSVSARMISSRIFLAYSLSASLPFKEAIVALTIRVISSSVPGTGARAGSSFLGLRSSASGASSDLPRVSGNSDRLAHLFDLLLRNALRHRSDRTPEIRITAQKENDRWLIGVQDNGVGIEAAWLERIFRPFVRLRGGTEGAGLSLATCRIIIERHGGRIWVESTPDQGSRFCFTLPAAG